MRKRVPYSTRRHLLAALTGMVVCLALASISLSNAQAAPPAPNRDGLIGSAGPPEAPTPITLHAAAAITDKIKFGESTLRAGKQAGKIARRAMSRSGRTLNYAKAKAVGGKTKWRRQFAAGFYWQGGRITHISATEFAEAIKLMPPSAAIAPQRKPNCKGVNKTVVVRQDRQRRIVDTYYDSCETLDLIFNRSQATVVTCGAGAGTAGLVGLVKKIPKLKEAVYMFAAMCAFFGQYDLGKLQKAVAKSDLGALIVRSDGTWHSAPKGDATYFADVRYYPQ